MRLSRISVIIPVRPNDKVVAAVRALGKADYPPELIEVLVAYGFSPSRQRNEAAKIARGEMLYFLDNDSEVHQKAFVRVVRAFEGEKLGKPPEKMRGFSFLPSPVCRSIEKTFFSGNKARGEIGAVGGPNIWERKESFWSAMAGIILESFFAHWEMSSRYRPIGDFRRAGEKELILCNMAVKRKIFNALGGFREELYPNEENEFLNRLSRGGFDSIYHPGIFVYRPRRESLEKILGAFFSYGRGRMEQMRVGGVWQSLPLLAPLALFVYLIGLFFYHPWFAFLPLILYFAMGFGSALGFATRRRKPYLAIFLPALFLVAHLSYAFGLLYGLMTDLERTKRRGREAKIEVVKVKEFGKSWT